MKKRIFFAAIAAAVILSGCGPQPRSQGIALFNGRNLDGWTTYLEDPAVDPASVWTVKNGVLRCAGKPNGYIRTIEEYADYKLSLEWRWVDVPTNSGVLLHTTGEDKIWPLCVEAQLKHEHAGDFVTIQPGSRITVNGVEHQPPQTSIFRVVPKQHPTNENPSGQWNRYDIYCTGDTIRLYVNGVLQNTAERSSLTRGAISLQSEGSPIEFRNIQLQPLN